MNAAAVEGAVREVVREAFLRGAGAVPGGWKTRQFMEMGLDSLDLVHVSRTLASKLSIPLPPTLLFDYADLPALQGYMRGKLAVGDSLIDAGGEEQIWDAPDATAALLGHLSSLSVGTLGLVEIAACVSAVPNAPGGMAALESAVDAVRAAPLQRWDHSLDKQDLHASAARFASFLPDIECFDAAAFNMGLSEAFLLDPNQRMLLMQGAELLRAAAGDSDKRRGASTDCAAPFDSWGGEEGLGSGRVPGLLPGLGSGRPAGAGGDALVGVFVGVSFAEYAGMVAKHVGRTTTFTATGTSLSVNAGRLSYAFGLKGPSVAIDTACSSSLVAVASARAYLHQRQCDEALAGGCNLLLSPGVMNMYAIAGMLAPDGRCKTMDALADGYVRAEASVLVLLRCCPPQAQGGGAATGAIL